MADIRTSHTATPLRGFAAMPKAKHIEAATRGGKTRGKQQQREAERRDRLALKIRAAQQRERRLHTQRIYGSCTHTLAPSLRAMAAAPLTLARKTRLAANEISEARAHMLRRRGLAKIRQLANGKKAYITDLGRQVARDT